MRMIRSLLLLLLLSGGVDAYRLPTTQAARRAMLQRAAQSGALAAAALVVAPTGALADLGDLEGFDAAPVPMKTEEKPVEDGFIPITLTDAGVKKKKDKEQTPGDRIKELEKKKDKT